jgi:hypothetical protein
MVKPAYLEDVIIPAERIAEVSRFERLHRMQRIEDLVRKVAWHEAGHAVARALNGGKLAQTTIIPEGDEHGVLWGLVEYDMADDPSPTERCRRAFSGLGAAAICELASTPDIDAIGEDIAAAVDDLRAVYSDQAELCNRAIDVWMQVLRFLGTPRVWRTADAFARELILRGTVKGFPEACISTDNTPIAGLEEALATALGPPGSRDQHDWMCLYARA